MTDEEEVFGKGQPAPQSTEKEKPAAGEENEIAAQQAKSGPMRKPKFLQRFGTHALVIVLVGVAALAMRSFYLDVQASNRENLRATAQAIAAPTMSAATGQGGGSGGLLAVEQLPVYLTPSSFLKNGIPRLALLDTTIPTRPRFGVTTYTVKQGDNLFSIAEEYGLEPASVLWANYDVLKDDPRLIKPGQELIIPPVDGVYYRWNVGESLKAVADFLGVDPEAIVEFPGNDLDPYETDVNAPNTEDGRWIMVPGGKRDIPDWGPPSITRTNPAVAAYYGPGSCGEVYEGPIGTGTFIWPTTATYISGYTYDPAVHPAIDIGGAEGNAVYASDTGVVVFAGWSNYGYGNMIVLDHGNTWQTAYAHLSAVGVFCGQGVYQGDVIGAVGTTGNSSGPHLHFEMTSTIYGKVNPLDYLILP